MQSVRCHLATPIACSRATCIPFRLAIFINDPGKVRTSNKERVFDFCSLTLHHKSKQTKKQNSEFQSRLVHHHSNYRLSVS